MGIPDHPTCLLRNLYAGQEVTVRTGHGKQTSSKRGKQYTKAVYCHPAYLTYTQTTSWGMLEWMKHKLELRLQGGISITSDLKMTPPLCQKVKNERASWWSERGEWKSWLKKTEHSENYHHGIWSHHFMANRWGNKGNSDRIYFGGLQKSLQMMTAADDCSHDIKKQLLLGKKLWPT